MKILLPNGGSHCGDTFRELASLWSELKLCELEISPDDFCWANKHGDILLYDYPRLDDKLIPQFKKGLFGNTVPNCLNCYPWIFWARSPCLLMKARQTPLLSYEDRSIESIFLGKIENGIQNNNRSKYDWSKAEIELFHCPRVPPQLAGPNHYPFSKKEYLEKLRQSKFGLCLSGYGPKCNREIELLGMGVVPLFAPEVDNTYHEPLVEGVHFIRINNPSEVKKTIESIDKNKWLEMHEAGQKWYERNASPKGSFYTTKKIMENL
jgi:hypothetical protein